MAGKKFLEATVLAQDPHVDIDGYTASATVGLTWELMGRGPVGHRVHVIDYDAATSTLYGPTDLDASTAGPFAAVDLADPAFHARNVFALVMHTLGRFEAALGRRVDWAFRAQQLKVVPHAFDVANAFYSRETESILFGYFSRDASTPGKAKASRVFTCLSHDVVVHETTHALLDGLRPGFMAPSSPDQAAFHEGFADLVALLSTFTLGDVVGRLLDLNRAPLPGEVRRPPSGPLIRASDVTAANLKNSVLLAVADRFVAPLGGAAPGALRRSVLIDWRSANLDDPKNDEPHARAEILVAAVMNAFVEVWSARLEGLGSKTLAELPRERVAEEGVEIARQLLTMAIRAIDYTPPIHLTFSDFLTAVLTADTEVRPDDSRYGLRAALKTWFRRYGIRPVPGAGGCWSRPKQAELVLDGTNFTELRHDPAEMFRLIWNNRDDLNLNATAYTHVSSIRPCVRVGPEDGQIVHETVTECLQYVSIRAADLPSMGLRAPRGVDPDLIVALQGGSTLILDEYGRLKYEVSNRLPRPGAAEGTREQARVARMQERLDYLARTGYLDRPHAATMRIADLHRRRWTAVGIRPDDRQEAW